MSAWANVATLGKAKNLKGGLLAYAREGLPFLLEEGLEVTFVPPVLRVPRTGRVVSVVNQGGGAYLVHFDTIDSIDLAEQLQDHSCLVRRADLPEDALEGAADLVGFTVKAVNGEVLGTVIALEENPAYALLVVKLAADKAETDGSVESRLARIPLVDAFVKDLDAEQNTLTVEVPEGLLDL